MRFNLLLVSNDSQAGNKVLKVISKVHKDNFIFEMPNMFEATKMLAKVHIDLLLVDLDNEPADLIGISQKYPSLTALGYYTVPSVRSKIDLTKHKLLKKSSLEEELLDEIKSMKKVRTENSKEGPSKPRVIASSQEYKDFSRLMESVV